MGITSASDPIEESHNDRWAGGAEPSGWAMLVVMQVSCDRSVVARVERS